ncbi:hypothetical protein J7443_19840 [Tropicibacter sp. R15_0]|uniref:DUF6455 family protein n=1 Tax=Tropicibacter sp. R15_0 TaxID=2821101 RepID=UPI001AD986FB|nr:DUF6455 family protein [Tropicibacter sp. R15_0]MBO9467501.1 hypothetical protein [Tropicibacter sp. R15_0]
MGQYLGDPARHFFMTRSVARTMGLSLSEEMQAGTLDAAAYARMVTNCRGCALVEACEQWLAQQSDLVNTPPPGCCNGDTLTKLCRLH